jgi:hypothetical protein
MYNFGNDPPSDHSFPEGVEIPEDVDSPEGTDSPDAFDAQDGADGVTSSVARRQSMAQFSSDDKKGGSDHQTLNSETLSNSQRNRWRIFEYSKRGSLRRYDYRCFKDLHDKTIHCWSISTDDSMIISSDVKVDSSEELLLKSFEGSIKNMRTLN